MENLFIVIEGCDRSGKTTIVKKLSNLNKDWFMMVFPDRTNKSGKMLDDILKKKEKIISKEYIHMLYSLNRYENNEIIKEKLKETTIICDRYYLSGAVYSMSSGLEKDWCLNTDKYVVKPDITFFIDVKADVICKRNNFGDEIYENVEFQEKVYENYKKLENYGGMICIDGNRPIEEIIDDIVEYIEKYKKIINK